MLNQICKSENLVWCSDYWRMCPLLLLLVSSRSSRLSFAVRNETEDDKADNVEMVVDDDEMAAAFCALSMTMHCHCFIVIARVLSSVVGGGNFDISTDLPSCYPSYSPTTMLPSTTQQTTNMKQTMAFASQ